MSAGSALLAVLAAATAAALAVQAPSRLRAPGPLRWPPWATAAVAAGCAVALGPRIGAVAVILAGVAMAAVSLWRRRRRRQAAEQVAAQVLESCELLAGELAAGRPPGEALRRAADSWPSLGPVAEAFRVGADVPAAMRQVADDLDGARDLRVVAAAWQVAHRTGEGLGVTVDRVAASLRAAAVTRRLVAGELASARATARLVAGLPLLALAMGSGAGGDPWGFLLRTPAGLACLAGGLAFGFAGLRWIEAIASEAGERA